MMIHEALLGLGVSEAARGLQQDAFNELHLRRSEQHGLAESAFDSQLCV